MAQLTQAGSCFLNLDVTLELLPFICHLCSNPPLRPHSKEGLLLYIFFISCFGRF